MRLRYLLAFLMFLSISFAYLPEDSAWKIPYSKYRLIYSVDINSTVYSSPLIEITIQIPHTYIDDMLQYYEAHNYTFNASMWATRLYYFNGSTGQQIQIPCRKALSGSSNYPFCSWNSTYRGVPDELHIFTENTSVEVGTNYFIVYMPLFYWDDFEYAGFDYGWSGGSIVSGGYEPTTGYKLQVADFGDYYGGGPTIASKQISIPIRTKQLIVSFDGGFSGTSNGDSCIKFFVLGIDNQSYYVQYSLNGKTTADLLKDLSSKYSVSPSFFKELIKIEVVSWSSAYPYWRYTYLDNLMIIPYDVNNQ